jgi:cysteinyl-tRNA synthetase
MDDVLGLDLERELSVKDTVPAAADGVSEAEIEALVAERAAAKAVKDFTRADEIRSGLKARGVILEDGPNGTVWRYG